MKKSLFVFISILTFISSAHAAHLDCYTGLGWHYGHDASAGVDSLVAHCEDENNQSHKSYRLRMTGFGLTASVGAGGEIHISCYGSSYDNLEGKYHGARIHIDPLLSIGAGGFARKATLCVFTAVEGAIGAGFAVDSVSLTPIENDHYNPYHRWCSPTGNYCE